MTERVIMLFEADNYTVTFRIQAENIEDFVLIVDTRINQQVIDALEIMEGIPNANGVQEVMFFLRSYINQT
jgi:hypothetical protein